MEVIRDIHKIPKIGNAVLTNGTFDGTHAGHVEILNQLIKTAKATGGKSVVLTYWPHPRIVLGKENSEFKLLFTIEERIELLSRFDLDYLIIIPFTKAFAQKTSTEFIQDILIDKIGVKTLVLGYNHRFGRNREGSYEFLVQHHKEFGINLEEIPKQIIEEEGVSSTRIRAAINEGNIELANKYLQKEFFIEGKVIKGQSLGRTINYPTANIDIENEHKIIPKRGVYAVKVDVDGRLYKGMLNIGNRPTVNNDNKLNIEVHIIGFDQNIYNQTIRIYFVKRIRNEIRFESINALKLQLDQDHKEAQNLVTL